MDLGVIRADDGDVADKSDISVASPRVLSVLTAATAVLAAGLVSVAVHHTDPASAPTVLRGVTGKVTVTLADSSTHLGADGQTVPRGASVAPAAGATARLVTQGRSTYVGALSKVDVVDGVTEHLEVGQAMVDARRGPGLSLETLAGRVQVLGGSLARVDGKGVLRVAVFEGGARFTSTGRDATTTVPPLYQVQVPFGGTAGRLTALQLLDDRWESLLASDLVAADTDLTGDAAQLSGNDGQRVLAAYRTSAASVTAGAPVASPLGDRALSVLLAQAGQKGGLAGRLATVTSARSDSGSWGVVAALVQAPVTGVSRLIDGLQAPVQAPPTTTVQAGPRPTTGTAVVPPPMLATAAPSAAPRPSRSPQPGRSTPPAPSPSPTPSPGLVQGVLNTVLGLLGPTPTPKVP